MTIRTVATGHPDNPPTYTDLSPFFAAVADYRSSVAYTVTHAPDPVVDLDGTGNLYDLVDAGQVCEVAA